MQVHDSVCGLVPQFIQTFNTLITSNKKSNNIII